MELTAEDIAHILKLIDEASYQDLEIEWKGMVVRVSRRADGGGPAFPQHAAPQPGAAPAPAPAVVPAAPAPAAPATARPAVPEGCIEVRAPVMGTFYRKPKPDQPAFVEAGAVVRKDDTLCLIEVMKVFTAVKAVQDGVVEVVLVDDAQLVEYGQPLFALRPAQP